MVMQPTCSCPATGRHGDMDCLDLLLHPLFPLPPSTTTTTPRVAAVGYASRQWASRSAAAPLGDATRAATRGLLARGTCFAADMGWGSGLSFNGSLAISPYQLLLPTSAWWERRQEGPEGDAWLRLQEQRLMEMHAAAAAAARQRRGGGAAGGALPEPFRIRVRCGSRSCGKILVRRSLGLPRAAKGVVLINIVGFPDWTMVGNPVALHAHVIASQHAPSAALPPAPIPSKHILHVYNALTPDPHPLPPPPHLTPLATARLVRLLLQVPPTGLQPGLLRDNTHHSGV
jgi:hypothetical protein